MFRNRLVFIFYTLTLPINTNIKKDNADKPNTSGRRPVI